MAKTAKRKRESGCGFIVVNGIVILILLAINVWVVKSFVEPVFVGIDTRFFQATQFVLPIFMIFFELWIFDRLTIRRRQS